VSALTTLINFSTGVAGLVLTLLGLMLAIFCRPMECWTRGFFITTFLVLIVYSAAVLTSDYAVMRFNATVLRPSVFMESLMSSLMMPTLCAFMLKLCDEPLRKSRLLRITLTLWGVYFALLIYTQFSTVIYSISDDGVYQRGVLYPVLLVAPAMIMLLNLIGLWRRRKRLTWRQFYALFVCLGAPKQEKFIKEHFEELDVTLMLGLGGSLDGYAGVAQRAPKWMIDLSLEWLYRLLKEPKRLGRMMRLPKFVLACGGEKLRRKRNG
jgi:hypothetical protein